MNWMQGLMVFAAGCGRIGFDGSLSDDAVARCAFSPPHLLPAVLQSDGRGLVFVAAR